MGPTDFHSLPLRSRSGPCLGVRILYEDAGHLLTLLVRQKPSLCRKLSAWLCRNIVYKKRVQGAQKRLPAPARELVKTAGGLHNKLFPPSARNLPTPSSLREICKKKRSHYSPNFGLSLASAKSSLPPLSPPPPSAGSKNFFLVDCRIANCGTSGYVFSSFRPTTGWFLPLSWLFAWTIAA